MGVGGKYMKNMVNLLTIISISIQHQPIEIKHDVDIVQKIIYTLL